MTHKLIKTDNYLLVVDDSDTKKGDWCYAILSKQTFENINPNLKSEDKKKIIAHLPLNGFPILEGVDLLPPYSRDQYPTEFECEMIPCGLIQYSLYDNIEPEFKPKTITTAKGVQWVGKYK
jgi:hypothetical protein